MKLAKNYHFKPNEKQSIIIGCLTYASARLYNAGNYERRNWEKDSGEPYPNWYVQKKEMKNDFWYKNLPSQSAQETLKKLEKSWKSFYALMKKFKKGALKHRPQPPYYKAKNSHYNIWFLKGAITIEDGFFRLSLPKQLKVYLKEEYSIEDNYLYVKIPNFLQLNGDIKQIEFKPLKNGKYKVSVVVEIPDAKVKPDNGRYLSIDLGVNNLMTCYDNANTKSFIISNGQWLSVNRYFDKKIKYYQAIANGQQHKKDGSLVSTRRIQQLYKKRRGQLEHLIHSATKLIVDYCVENNINRVIIGDITKIRENTNHGKKNNQKLHKLPFNIIYKQLEYKLAMKGIKMVKQNERYTSQCSPYSPEVNKKHGKKSNRKHRGLYIDKKYNTAFNADSVGAFNILRQYLKHIKSKLVLEVKGLNNPEIYSWNNLKFCKSTHKGYRMVA
ncbi:MAG: RNA-guided endonuclease InsQ/TnpB family protein [bacterium]